MKVRRKRSGLYKFIIKLIMVTVIIFIYCFINNPEKEYDNKITPFFSTLDKNSSLPISTDELNSSNAILIRLEDNAVLLEKDIKEKVYPASLTKIMTAIVAIENLPNLEEKITLSDPIFQPLYEANASVAGFQPGEEVRAIDLLYGVMLPSGAECCIGLANMIEGSEENFVKLMNQKALEIGMNNTHFENTTGLHSENHYTTIKDLSILLKYALKNDTFREIFTSHKYSIPSTNKHPNGITMYNTMFTELGEKNVVNGVILGGKTGYTNEAGLCLATLAKVYSQEYILITTGAKGNHYSEQYNITDALTVYNSIKK